MILHFRLQLFHFKTLPVNITGQYPFQPIKFMNLVVSSPCEAEPHNKIQVYCVILLASGVSLHEMTHQLVYRYSTQINNKIRSKLLTPIIRI